ncbi:AEC family transporter [Pseudoxanthobacter sp.]|uniref:AEC family transporter n=1 Tax=Pseudoxanthobacter sp. TaxID=1925742 RepID=UPI002FDF23D8
MSFTEIVLVLAPVFGLLALGWGAAALRILPAPVGDALGAFAATVSLPTLLFNALATAHFPDLSPWPFWGAYFSGVVVAWVAGDICYRRFFGGDPRLGVVAGVSAAFSNTAMLTIPVVFSVWGKAGDVPILLLLSVHTPLMTIVATLLFEHHEAKAEARAFSPLALMRRMVINILKNPIVIGILAGAVVRTLQIPIEGPFREVVHRLADTTVPVALFALGMSLKRYGIGGHLVPSSMLVLLKLMVMPAVVFFMSRHVFTMPPIWSAVATVSAASATGVNAYLIANRAGVGMGLASNTITLSTAAAALTLGLWLAIIGLP